MGSVLLTWIRLGADMFDSTLVDSSIDGLGNNWSCKSKCPERWFSVWDIAEVVVVSGSLDMLDVRFLPKFVVGGAWILGINGSCFETYIDGSLMQFVSVVQLLDYNIFYYHQLEFTHPRSTIGKEESSEVLVVLVADEPQVSRNTAAGIVIEGFIVATTIYEAPER